MAYVKKKSQLLQCQNYKTQNVNVPKENISCSMNKNLDESEMRNWIVMNLVGGVKM